MSTGFFAQFTPDQLRAGYARNATQLAWMRDKAIRTGRRVNGYTAEQLTEHAETAPMDPADFPTVPSAASPLQPAEKGILISTDHVKKLLGTMPKRATIPCLQTVNVGTIDAKPYAVATDLDTPLVVALERTNDGASFPTTDRVMIKEGDRAVIKVVLSAAMLQTLARIGKEVGANGATNTVTLEIPTDAEYLDKRTGSVVAGIRFTAGDGDVRADGVVMPCRL